MDWKRAKIFDFTGATGAGAKVKGFGEEVVKTLREPGEDKLAIVFDTAYGSADSAPLVVRDHINLSGFNPLIGPNNPIGERFPVVNDIYVADGAGALSTLGTLGTLEKGVVAGMKVGRAVDASDVEFIKTLGASCYCFNLVPTMLIAAHAGWKIIAVVGPEGNGWQKDCLAKITGN